MAKKPSKPVVEEEVVTPEVAVEAETVETPTETVDAKGSKKAVAPVPGTGRFQAVEVKDGFILYNPDGVAVSGVLAETQAKDLATRNNAGMHLK